MKFILFPLLVIIPALIMSFAMWLIMKKTKVEGKFLQIFLVSTIVTLASLFPVFKNFISLAVLFLLFWKWEDIKFWPKVSFWPDSLLVIISGWVTLYAVNYLYFKVLTSFR